MDDRTEQLHRALQKFIYHVDALSNEDDPSGNGFHREYRDLRELGLQNKDVIPATHGKIPYNIKKNRYKDIVPYDETRVTLTEKPGVQGSDYINANYVLDAHQREGYIASQGPLPHTLEDFWRMINELKVKVVMMACKEVEVGKKKCAKYWVEEGAEHGIFGEYKVACVHNFDIADDCHERHLQLILPDDSIQDVYQYHYTGWPDHGIPDDIDVILAMIKRMRDIRMHDPNHAPVVVHCSAGCGRTGTICAIDYAWEILKSGQMTEDFNLFEIVKLMREQRQSMIQTPEQYEMAHLAIKELFQKHIEMMNESEYVNVELKRDVQDEYYNVTIGGHEERESDVKKLQKDALDTLGLYMGKVEESSDISTKEPDILSKEPDIVLKETDIVSKKPDIVSKKPDIVSKKPELVLQQPETKQTTEDKTVIKIVENNNIQPKVETEQIQRRPYVNINPNEGAPIGETENTPESPSVEHLRNSFEKKQSSPSPTESGPKFASSHSVPKPSSKETTIQSQSPKILHSDTTNMGPPPTVSRPTVVEQISVSGPRFAGPKTTPSPQQNTVNPPSQHSGPRFAPSTPPAKFKSVINVGTNAIITQGNRPQNGVAGRSGSIKQTKTQTSDADYEMAFPVADDNRGSTNSVNQNSNTSTAVYAVPDKTNNTPIIPSNVYSEVHKVHSSKQDKGEPVDSAYESIDMKQSVKTVPRSRQYEDVELPMDGLYSTVGDTANQNNVPPIPKREYLEEEHTTEQKTSMTDKLKNKFTTTLFSSNSKGSSSSDNTDNKTIPGFNQRLDKKVKGPRTMPWNKKKSKS